MGCTKAAAAGGTNTAIHSGKDKSSHDTSKWFPPAAERKKGPDQQQKVTIHQDRYDTKRGREHTALSLYSLPHGSRDSYSQSPNRDMPAERARITQKS